MSRNGKSPAIKPTKKEHTRKGASSGPKDLARSQDDSPEADQLVDEAEGTWLDLFGDGSEQVTIELIRVSPAFVADQPCTGFCGNVQPGASLQTLKDLYGGGKYKLQKKVNGQFTKGGVRYLEIVGVPILSAKSTVVVAEPAAGRTLGPAVSGPGASATISVDGMTLPADFQEFKRSLMEIMMIKAALREPDPLNTELLKIALNQAGPKDELTSMLSAIGKIKDIASELSPASSAGDGWMGLVSKGLDAFGSFMKSKQTAIGPGPIFAGAPEVARAVAGKEPALLLESPAEKPVEVGEQMNMQQKILAGLNIIVAGFKLRPAKEVSAVVDILAEQLAIPEAERGVLIPFRENLFNKAELMLADDFLDAEDANTARSEFAAYFSEIFNQYCRVQS